MLSIYRAVPALTLITTMSACGGSSGSQTDFEAFEARLEDGVLQSVEVASLSRTAFAAVPTTGSATFDGVAAMLIDPVLATDADDIVVLGDVAMTANFGASTVTGDITNMQGAMGETEETAVIFDVAGTLVLGSIGSQIGRDVTEPGDTTLPNEFLTSLRGTLGTPEGDFDIVSTVEGRFMGTRVNGPANKSVIKGILATDENGTATRDGVDLPFSIEIVAEN